MAISNFVVIEAEYGKFVINRHCALQAESLIKTGRPHIQDELNNILALIGQLPQNAIVVDAGANVGLVAIPVSKALLARGGVVYAFEPQRMMSYALCGSAVLNDLENLIVYNKALGAITGTLGATKPDYGKPQDFGLFSLKDQTTQHPQRVDVVSVDSLDLPRLDFLKIDVEGMEIEVLKGASASIRRHLPLCWIEYWKCNINEIKTQFSGLEYKFYIMDKLNMLCATASKLADLNLRVMGSEV